MAKLLLFVAFAGAVSCASAGFNYNSTKIRGVNLGGWLVLEKWMTPSLFAGLPDTVVDEYTLVKHLGYTAAEKKLRAHWDSWVTEADIIALKNAGINHLRIPFGYWALENPAGQPWVNGSWAYVMKAVGWAKKQGLQVMVDFHGAPGSQNGQDHSGRIGPVDFYSSQSNLDLSTRVVGRVAQIFNTAEWKDTVTIIEVLNEPIIWADYQTRLATLKKYYLQAYDAVRKNNPNVIVAVHDAFISPDNWYYLGTDPHYSRVMLDTHHYQLYTEEQQKWSCDQQYSNPCTLQTALSKANQKLLTVVGEWSIATPTNCAKQDYFAKQQIGVFEKSSSGWFMWSFKNGQGWNEWDFLASVSKGWINLKSPIAAKC